MKKQINFEIGKQYVVEVTENGIVPTMEFTRERFHDKDVDELCFLTDEEKALVVANTLKAIKAEFCEWIDRKVNEVKGDKE